MWYFLLDGSGGSWLLHRLLFLFLLHRKGWRRRREQDLPLHGPRWVVDEAVRVPVGVAVVLHALEEADGSWGRLLDEHWWRRGGLFGWRGRRRRRCRFWSGFLGGAVWVVAGVTEDGHGACGHVDDVGLAEGILPVAQEEDVSLGDGWRRRSRRLCGLWNPFHWRWRRSDFALLVRGWVTHEHWHAQFALEVGSVGAVGVLQVPHLLVEHPQLVDLVELRGRKTKNWAVKEKKHLMCINKLEYAFDSLQIHFNV